MGQTRRSCSQAKKGQPPYERLSRATDSQCRRDRAWQSGKTSLVDAALYDTGAVNRIGKVDDGSSISDYDPDEIKRHMSINLTVAPVEWGNGKINLLDTPGYADFVGEVMAAVRVADAALVVVSAEKGVEVGTELVWRHANKHDLPRIVFVNKLDRENTSYDHALESLRAHFGTRIVPLTIPIGEQATFSGVVDLVAQRRTASLATRRPLATCPPTWPTPCSATASSWWRPRSRATTT